MRVGGVQPATFADAVRTAIAETTAWLTFTSGKERTILPSADAFTIHSRFTTVFALNAPRSKSSSTVRPLSATSKMRP